MDINSLLGGNAVFSGMVGATLVGFVLVQARAIPGHLWKLFLSQFVVSLTIRIHEEIFRDFAKWLADHPQASHSRRLNVIEWFDSDKEISEARLTPGSGYHLIRENGRRFLVRREVLDSPPGQNGGVPVQQETYTIRTLGRSQEPMRKLIETVKGQQEKIDAVPVFIWTGHQYKLAERRPRRTLDTVYLPQAVKADLIADIHRFLGRKAWYAERNIPWRRGYCLEGPPGTGKTTLIFAIASLLGKSVNIISPSSVSGDLGLQAAINAAGPGIVVIEDIDSFKISNERAPKTTTKSNTPQVANFSDDGYGLTLSGLLNAIDGLAAKEGRLLFISSNHADKLDAALLRPGRIDRRIFLGPATIVEAEEMYRRFFPGQDPTAWLKQVESRLPLTPAVLQNELFSLSEDSGQARALAA